jgi:hypothetical protein
VCVFYRSQPPSRSPIVNRHPATVRRICHPPTCRMVRLESVKWPQKRDRSDPEERRQSFRNVLDYTPPRYTYTIRIANPDSTKDSCAQFVLRIYS